MTERARAHFDRGLATAPSPTGPGATDALGLEALVVPLTQSQLPEAAENFALWGETRRPLAQGATPFADLILVMNAGETREALAVATAAPSIAANFRSVHVLTAGLSGDDDEYSIGNATGANNLFFFTLGALTNYSVFLLMETDCQPMISGWLSEANRCVATQMGTKWVLGAQYRGDGPIGDEFWRHINGNAFYRSGADAFQRFYRDEFLAFYGDRYDHHDFRFGYDAAHELYLTASPDRVRARTVLSKFGHTDFVVNLRSHDDDSAIPRGEGSEGVLWHRGGWMKRQRS